MLKFKVIFHELRRIGSLLEAIYLKMHNIDNHRNAFDASKNHAEQSRLYIENIKRNKIKSGKRKADA